MFTAHNMVDTRVDNNLELCKIKIIGRALHEKSNFKVFVHPENSVCEIYTTFRIEVTPYDLK